MLKYDMNTLFMYAVFYFHSLLIHAFSVSMCSFSQHPRNGWNCKHCVVKNNFGTWWILFAVSDLVMVLGCRMVQHQSKSWNCTLHFGKGGWWFLVWVQTSKIGVSFVSHRLCKIDIFDVYYVYLEREREMHVDTYPPILSW